MHLRVVFDTLYYFDSFDLKYYVKIAIDQYD
jgi:hypothetical protein